MHDASSERTGVAASRTRHQVSKHVKSDSSTPARTLKPTTGDGAPHFTSNRPLDPRAVADPLNGEDIVTALRSQRKLITVILGLCLAAGGAYIALTPARYIATASVLIDSPKLRGLRQEPVLSDARADEYLIESQSQILRSDEVARLVVQRLDLLNSTVAEDDFAFLGPQFRAVRMAISELLPWLTGVPPEIDRVQSAVDTLQRNLTVKRTVMSRVVEVSYDSIDPKRAAQVANAFIEAYAVDKRKHATLQSLAWLRRLVETAEHAVVDFKAENDSRESDLEIANNREAIVAREMRLKELESSALTYRSLYDSTLQRYAELDKQQNLLTGAELRILSAAQVPQKKSQPRSLLVLAFASAFGLIVGTGAGLLRARLAKGFEGGRQIERLLGIRALGALPKVSHGNRKGTTAQEKKKCSAALGPGRMVLDVPASQFAETIRAIKLAVDAQCGLKGSRVIGIVSALPHEGRGTVCTNLAQLVGRCGKTLLIIDADLRESQLTKTLTGLVPLGLAHVLRGDAALSEVVWDDPLSGGAFLPSGGVRDIVSDYALMSSEAMERFIAEMRERFEYIVVCLPPAATSIDAAAAAKWVDSFVMVLEWRKTSRAVVSEILERVPCIGDKTIGAILNKVNPSFFLNSNRYRG